MSVIVAVRKNNQSVIASDGLSCIGSMKIQADNAINSSKLVKGDGVILGLAGWSALQDIMEHVVRNEPDILSFTSRAELFNKSLQLHTLLEERYHINTAEDSDQPVESSQIHMLLATKESIYEVESYRAVYEYSKFFAIGSGNRFALGAMRALYDKVDDAVEIARAGVEAACYFCESCDLPIYIETIE